MPRKTKQESLQTRDQILDSAEELFLSQGVSRTSLQHIAQAAHVTRGAIYWHFKDKLALLQALLDRATVPMEAVIKQVEQRQDIPPLDQVRYIMTQSFRQVTEDTRLHHALELVFLKIELVGELADMRERYLECMNTFLSTIEHQLQAAVDARTISLGRVSTREVARALQAIGDGLLAQWLLLPYAFDLALTIEEAVDAYLAGLCIKTKTVRAPESGTDGCA